MKYGTFLMLGLCWTVLVGADQAQPWTQVYKKRVTEKEGQKNELIFKEEKTIPFTQLLFSWNAHRPDEGYFEFFIRVRDQATKKWQDWHKMLSWGAHLQRSFFSRVKGSRFDYARFEMDESRRGDAFQIKVVSYEASLSQIKLLAITASDFSTFSSEAYVQRGKGLSSFRVQGVPKKSQLLVDHPRAHALCSPTSMSMVVESFIQEYVDPLKFAERAYDPGLNAFGNWPFTTAHAFEHCQGAMHFYVTRLNSFEELYMLLRETNMPLAVSVRGTLNGGKKPYNNGHLMVVVGWDASTKKVICFDPAFDDLQQVEVAYDIHDFVHTWECSRRLVYKPEVAV